MMTWRLRRGLNRSTPLTSLYHRLQIRRIFIEPTTFKLPALGIFKALMLTVLPVVFIFLGAPFILIVFATMLPYSALLISLACTGFGLYQCVIVSGQLAREQEIGIYDILCACPPGRIGLHWAYAVNWLFNHRLLRGLLLTFLVLGTFATLLVSSANLVELSILSPNESSWTLTLVWLLASGANIASIWLEYIQTLILSSLVAMLVAGFTRQSSLARFYAAGIFLGIQTVIFIMIASVTSLLEDSVGYYVEQPFIYQIGYPIIIFIAAYALREVLILLLWQAVVRTLNADPSELDSLIHGRL